jgi:site-specific DNA-cytosine methylase
MALRVGSICTGASGLEMALRDILGDIELVFMADNDPAVSQLLALRYPGIRNLGDISAVDWGGDNGKLAVDILTAGFPLSHARMCPRPARAKDSGKAPGRACGARSPGLSRN